MRRTGMAQGGEGERATSTPGDPAAREGAVTFSPRARREVRHPGGG